MLGPVSDVHALLRRWTVMVSPSVEPDPNLLSLLEAMSVGVPVVATAHGGPAEQLGDAGLLVPPDYPVALRDALAATPGRPERPAGGLRESGCPRRRVEERYRLQDRLAELLHVVATAPRRGRP